MSRKPTFSIRSLLVLTTTVAIAVTALAVLLRRTPRPYKTLERFANSYEARGWTVEVAPDLDGPYRTAGDDWSAAAAVQCNSGQPVKGWVESGGTRRAIHYPARIGTSYIVEFLETRDDRPTYLILSKPDGLQASSGG